MRKLLIDGGVDLTPERASARALYEGPGANAQQAWEAFRDVAVKPAFDPIRAWGDVQVVKSAGFLFEAMFSQGWPSRHGSRGMPEHYELMLTRQFSVGDAGNMMGLCLTVFVPAANELRELKDSFFGGDDGGDPETFAAGAKAWIAQVEASPAFIIPMTRHEADRFSFGVDDIG